MIDGASNTNRGASAPRQLPWKGAVVMLAILVAFYLLREHWNHIAGSAAYLLLLACPLMHLFGHGHGHGHGHHHSNGGAGEPGSRSGREGTF